MIRHAFEVTLGQAGARTPTTTIIFFVLVLIGAILMLTLAILYARKALFAAQGQSEAIGPGWLDQLRRMKADGRITQEEFDVAKSRLAASMRQSAEQSPSNRNTSGTSRESSTPRPPRLGN